MKRKLVTSIHTIAIIVIITVYTSGCANIIPPLGGPRDTIPPMLVHAVPKDSSVNVASNKIVLYFNEYVEVKDISNNLIVSPLPKLLPIVDYKLNTVTIKLKDSLEPNTTYQINFGNALKDINEGNIAKNFSYVFATGKKVDSGFLAGKVLLARTGKVDSTLIVVLYKNLADTAVVKTSPRYYTKLDGKGNFVFHHLPVGTFNAFVLENGYDKKYNDSTKLFAFLKEPVQISDTTKLQVFYAYAEAEKKEKATTSTAKTSSSKTKTDNRVRLIPMFDNNQQDLISPLEIDFSKRLKSYDSSKIILCDTLYRPLKNVTYSIDTSFQKIFLNYKWREETGYRLIVKDSAITDTSNSHLTKTDTLKFVSRKESEYGSLKIRFLNIDMNKNPVLLLYQSDKLTESVVLTRNEFYRKLIKPGDYELRILYDDNKNGKWDPGNYKLKSQPEIVQLIPNKMNVRANWDNEVTINL